ncbi:shikimate kinase, partial [Salmonella enterica subsp. enterica serovar Enteritidis]|nr:shikimate kinase [Salmonella enterica subsp. enterica serovar Enteritidis]
QKLTELFCKRDPIYQQLADITIVTGYSSPKKMVHDILLQLQDANITI